MAQRLAITVRVTEEALKVIDADTESEFCTRSEAAAARLEAACAKGATLTKSDSALRRDRKEQLEIEAMERKAAVERRELISIQKAAELVRRDYANIRSRLLSLPNSVPGLTPEQVADLRKSVQDCMTDLSGEQRETWDDVQ